MSTLSLRKIKHDSSSVDNIALNSDGTTTMNRSLIIDTATSGVPSISLKHANTNADNFIIQAGTPGVTNGGLTIRDIDAEVNRLIIDSAGRVTMPNQPYFHVGGGNGQSYSSGNNGTYIPASVITNTGNHFNSSTGVFTAPVTGNYVFTWVLLIQNANNSAQSDPKYFVNGSGFYYGNRDVVGNPNTFGDGFIVQKASIIRRLSSGDTFYVTGHLSTGTWQFYNDANWTHYTGCLIG
jgi:hypothetical protein